MAHDTLKISTPLSTLRRIVLFGLMSSGLVLASAPVAPAAEKLSCLPVQHMTETSAVAPANKKIGVSVAYLKVPFYANFKTELEDGAQAIRLHSTTLSTGTAVTSRLNWPICRTSWPKRRTSFF